MPNSKVIAAFYLAAAVILYCAYATLIPRSSALDAANFYVKHAKALDK